MADALAKLELVLRPDIGSDIDTLDVLNYIVLPDGWIQSASADTAVDEVLTFNLPASTQNALADLMLDFDRKIKQIRWARHPLESNGVWLRTQLENETGARQAYILDARPGALHVTSPAIWSNMLYQYVLGLKRVALWEASAQDTQLTGTISTVGGYVSYHPSGVAGDQDSIEASRVKKLTVAPASGKFTELWVGAKGVQFGAPDIFEPNWECAEVDSYWEDIPVSWILTDMTRTGGGLELTCDFATNETLVPRVYFSLPDFQPEGDRAGQEGTYLVLLQAYVTSGEVRVRCGEGYASADSAGTKYISTFRAGDRVSITSTGYQLYALGEFNLPPAFPGADTIGIDFSALRIEAERVSGSGSLVMRRLILIPSAEGYLYVKCNSGVTYGINRQQRLEVYCRTDGRAVGSVVSINEGFIDSIVQPESHDFGLPWGVEVSGRLYFAASSDASLASQISVTVDPVRRYRSLRGSV